MTGHWLDAGFRRHDAFIPPTHHSLRAFHRWGTACGAPTAHATDRRPLTANHRAPPGCRHHARRHSRGRGNPAHPGMTRSSRPPTIHYALSTGGAQHAVPLPRTGSRTGRPKDARSVRLPPTGSRTGCPKDVRPVRLSSTGSRTGCRKDATFGRPMQTAAAGRRREASMDK